ncbi:hypothetical protein PMZ80_004179 [Knufia obscura]|uniref:Uncharacterized protein n=2 Tax=Knufia TaxID=430999 RepID=A0AAN8I3M8_9EURO|nr:hypothetical protein PMZ80_004179 [Knufia obscura]KAK5948695.1 hypothetical protein OHC33_010298 [Knufia fluminis]
MALDLPDAVDPEKEEHGPDLMSDITDGSSAFIEMEVDSPDRDFDQELDFDLPLDHDDDGYAATSSASPQSFSSNRHRFVSPNTIVVAPPRIRTSTPVSPDYEDLISDEGELEPEPFSPFEALPTELVQSIATQASSDLDLGRLALTSPTFATQLNPDNAGIWRKRFLARYDYPILHKVHEFAIAYKVRRFVLRKLDGRAFALGQSDRAEHQLLVIKDMVLETYNRHKPYLPPPTFSKNLAAMSSPSTSPWILKFMGSALYDNEKTKFGRPHMLFDTLQVTLSHLVLSQRSPVLINLPSSRDNYDLARVYNYNKPLVMLLERLPDDAENVQKPFKSKRFPNLRSPTPEPVKPRFKLDMHTLLHIRNFWQRHFADDVQGIGENTYASMARSLVALGKTPRKWDCALQEQLLVSAKWYGHYSCLHPWPKSRQDLEERQSCAEDWKHIDPMVLDLEASTSNKDGAWWPPAFSTIPAFADSMPGDRHHKEYNVKFLRGIAPFLELKHHDKSKSAEDDADGDDTKLPKWHPFLASRLHGFVHDIPDATVLGRKPRRERFSELNKREEEQAIPGWKHIIMIMYKPTSRQLLSVLEHAMEDYGGASGTEMDFNTASIWNEDDGDGGGAGTTDVDTIGGTQAHVQPNENQNQDFASLGAVTTSNINNTAQQSTTAAAPGPVPALSNVTADTDTSPTEEQIEAQLRLQITRRIKAYSQIYQKRVEAIQAYVAPPDNPYQIRQNPKPLPKPLPQLWSPEHIRTLEESHSSAAYTTWDDGTIDYAYAYEGVIIPGGKIMLGRWWRVQGIEGMGAGKEVGPDTVGVEVRAVAQEDTSEHGSYEDDSSGKKGKGKRKAKKQGKNKSKRRSTRKKNKRKVTSSDSEEDNYDEQDADYEDDDHDEEQLEPEKEVEYEFVTMLNGEESRAVNACKGLERGPFVFWTG